MAMIRSLLPMLVASAGAVQLKAAGHQDALACFGKVSEHCENMTQCTWNEKACMPLVQNASHCSAGGLPTDCFDVTACAQGEPGPTADKRWAFVFTHTLQRKLKGISEDNIAPLRKLAEKIGNTDLVLLVPQYGAVVNQYGQPVSVNVTDDVKESLKKQGVQLREVPWGLPPNHKYAPTKAWCGYQDLMRLHVLGMDEYAAVAYFDTDTQLTGNGDPTIPLRCAAKGEAGHFLSTGGPAAPFNIGYFAVKPHKALLEASVNFAQVADFDKYTGWGGGGMAPSRTQFIGAECGQGFVHTLMYKHFPEVEEAFAKAGAKKPVAKQMERCVWNYQKDKDCNKADTSCDSVVMIHKDDEKCRKRTSLAGADMQKK